MQQVYFTTLIVAVFLAVIHTRLSTALEPSCSKRCETPEECNDYAICKHGGFTDNCGRKICWKGPDETCGDYRRGKCYSSLLCSNCGFCQGCSDVTMTCSSHNCTNILEGYRAHYAINYGMSNKFPDQFIDN